MLDAIAYAQKIEESSEDKYQLVVGFDLV